MITKQQKHLALIKQQKEYDKSASIVSLKSLSTMHHNSEYVTSTLQMLENDGLQCIGFVLPAITTGKSAGLCKNGVRYGRNTAYILFPTLEEHLVITVNKEAA
jgi:hypothetical protein